MHERPLLRPGEEIVLEEGMVLNVEPLTGDREGIMYHVEDLVEITASGTRILSLGLAPRELPVIGKPIPG
jgi:Xaa-Pro aminopeptidase